MLPGSRNTTSKGLFARVFPFAVFVTGILCFCLRILDFNLSLIPGDLGDSRFIHFLLEHGHRWMTGHEASFWNAEFMYPFRNSIALSDNMLGTIPLYSVWRLLGFSAETSYQLWWLCVCTLNYWICYIVLKKWGQKPEAAAILSWLFAFSLFNIGQLNYMQMIVRFAVPVVFYAAAKMVASPSLKYLTLYCFGLVIQLYCVMYTGIYLFYFSLLFLVVYCILTNYYKNILYYFSRRRILFSIAIPAAAVLLVLWILLPYYQMSKIVGLRWYREVIPNLPTWKSFLYPHESSLAWPFFRHMGPTDSEYWLHYLFPGAVLFITLIASPLYLIYAAAKKKQVSPLLKTFIICSFILALLHLRTEGGLTLYALIFKLPGINSMRVPIRFMHIAIFLLVFIFGNFISRLNIKFLLLVFCVAFADSLFDPALIARTPKKELAERKENLRQAIDASANKNYKYLAVIDTTQPSYITHLDAMLVAQSKGIKTLNGYSSYCPDAYGEFFRKCNRNGLLKWANDQQIPLSAILVIDRSGNK
jgi:hypothetical protein